MINIDEYVKYISAMCVCVYVWDGLQVFNTMHGFGAAPKTLHIE